jgi:hypothetical protein
MTYLQNNFSSTSTIASDYGYIDDASTFFSEFSESWKSVKSQVLKLEQRQTYVERGNVSLELFLEGKVGESIALIPEIRSGDLDLYKNLQSRKVDFFRCRPVQLPLSEYLKWEFECYHFNIKYGEKIYCLDWNVFQNHFDEIIQHDFMVFDHSLAFIHDYDDRGEIQGGWVISKPAHITNLIAVYSLVKAMSLNFEIYMKKIEFER